VWNLEKTFELLAANGGGQEFPAAQALGTLALSSRC
jgi:hypothetical protein